MGCCESRSSEVLTSINGNGYCGNVRSLLATDNLDQTIKAVLTEPHLQQTLTEKLSSTEADEIIEDRTDAKLTSFRQFDSVVGYSDHHYRNQAVKIPPSTIWQKRIFNEWRVLQKDLPERIFVRACEDRIDLLRAVIVGAPGTPYHDGLFFFDICFPPDYPLSPPLVHYRSGGLRLNPNLYACGSVCLSLLNTWQGSGCERWKPSMSTILQVLVSIQGLVLNAMPYFNEPGFSIIANTWLGKKKSLAYNEDTFLLSCRSMLYSLRKPPEHFDGFVAGHFCKQGSQILRSCKAYLAGVQVGCSIDTTAVLNNPAARTKNPSKFQKQLKKLYGDMFLGFSNVGADLSELGKLKQVVRTQRADTA